MLTLLPLSGIQDVFKRRNSTTMEQFTDRRGSISVYDTYSLPSSKADMRRFSSYEQLAPLFQQILSQQEGIVGRVASTPAPAPVPTSPSTASNSSTSPTIPSPLVRSRRGSIGSRFASAFSGSFRRQKSAASTRPVYESESSDVSCDDLDAKLAEIKGKLAQFKSEDLDISQRVEDLSSSVEEMYVSTPECYSPLYHCEDRTQMHRSSSFQSYRRSASSSGLRSISENDSDFGDRREQQDEEEEELPARPPGQVTLRRSTPVQRSRPSSYASISEEPELTHPDSTTDTKAYCLPNNTCRPTMASKTQSLTQLPNIIRNDLSSPHVDHSEASRKRNSVISIMSDSVLITHRHLPAMRSLLKEQEL